jgi:hypothetical protein
LLKWESTMWKWAEVLEFLVNTELVNTELVNTELVNTELVNN